VEIRIVPVYSDVADAERTVNIITSVSSVAAPYSNISVPDIPVTIKDLQKAGIGFSRDVIRANEGTETVTIRLQSEPRANVVVDLAVLQDPEGASKYASVTIEPPRITFTPEDYGSNVDVNFILANDGTAYGDVQMQVIATFRSTDHVYSALEPTPITITVLEGDPAPAWIITDITGVTPIAAAPGTPPLVPRTVVEHTGVLLYRVTPKGKLWRTVTLAPTFAPGTKQKGIITPSSFTFVPGVASTANFLLTFPSNNAETGDQDVVIWHVVTGVDDEPGYRALSPNLGGSELTVKLIESDRAGINLGNGASGVILAEEPNSTTAVPIVTSVGIVLNSRPAATVQLLFYEAARVPTTLVAVRAPATAAEQQLTLVSEQTLTFTESDWFLPHPVVMYATFKTGDQGRRIASLCANITSPDDDFYAALPPPCYDITVTEFGDEIRPIIIYPDSTVEIEVDEVSSAVVTGPGPLFQRFTKYWRIRAFQVSPRLELATTPEEVEVSFRVNASYYTNQDAVNVMLNPDTVTLTEKEAWVPVNREVFNLQFVDGTDEVKGRTRRMGTYFLGQAWPGLSVAYPSTAPPFVEKGLPSGLLRGLDISPSELTGNNPIAVSGARVGLEEPFDVDTDLLNLAGCANVTEGCIIGNVFAAYFDRTGELTLKPANQAPPGSPGSTRRRLLQQTDEPTTEEYVAVLDSTTFQDTNNNPAGTSRSAKVTIVDTLGAMAIGPLVTLSTVPVNDAPVINVNVLSLNYTEKELVSLNPTTVVFDVDSQYYTRAQVELFPPNEAGDTLVYAIEERKARYRDNIPPLDIPLGVDSLQVDIDLNSDTPNFVIITGNAPSDVYKFALDSIKFRNNGPKITNTMRKITYRIFDDLGLGNDLPNPEKPGIAVRNMLLFNVNDPPVANQRQTPLILQRPGASGISQLLATDPEDDVITFNITCLPGKGTVTLNDVNTGEYTYVSDPDKPGTDTFVFFAWDGELSSRFATVTVRSGAGIAAPVATDMTLEVWESSATSGLMPATDPDGPADIYRYQISSEPNSPSALVLTQGVASLFRYSSVSGFVYTAATTSVVVRRVSDAMAALPLEFDFNAVRGTAQHPGYHADTFTFKVIDLAGRVSNEARVWINVRLTRERNTPPISTALAGADFTTTENVPLAGAAVAYRSADVESPNNLVHTILVTPASVTPAFAGPRFGAISRVSSDVNDARFQYTPSPFFHGVENLRYFATDAHGAQSQPVDLRITVTEVNQAPMGACAPASAMDADVKIAMGTGSALVIAASEGATIKALVQAKVAADVGTLRAQFVSYAAVVTELEQMSNITGGATTAIACGDAETLVRLVHTERVGFVMLAFDADNFIPGSARYVVKAVPTLSSDGSVGGNVFPWVAPNYTEIPSEDPALNSTFEWKFLDRDFPSATQLAAEASVTTSALRAPALVFTPRTGVNGLVVFKWAAVDALGAEGPENILTFKVQCPGGEKIVGPACVPCAAGLYNDRVLLDQTSCTACPAGTQTPTPGSTRCAACPANTYTSEPGTATCPSCPARMRSLSGSNNIDMCKCEISTIQLSQTRCHPCDLFRTKCDVLGQILPMPYRGHWVDPSDPVRVLDCIPGVACLEKFTQDEVKNRLCAPQRFQGLHTDPAYVGNGCFVCQDEHYRHAGHCHHCGGSATRAWRFWAVIALYVVMVGSLLEAASSPAVGALGILVTFLQISASFKYLSISWPKSLFAWLTATSVSFLDLELWGAECLYPDSWTYFAKFRLALFQPVLWLAVIMCSVFLRVLRQVAVEYAWRTNEAVNLRINASTRWRHKKVDPDAATWKGIADERHGLPLDRPELKLSANDDVLNDTETLELQLGDYDRERDYLQSTGKFVPDRGEGARPGFIGLTKKHASETLRRAKPCGMLLFQWGYFLLAQQCMSFFDCKSDGEQSRLVADPSVRCYHGTHLAHLPLAIIAVAVYPVGMLVGSYFFIFAFRASGPRPRVNARMQVMTAGGDPRMLKLVSDFEYNFGLLYADARPEWINWNLVDMGKKLAIVVVQVWVPYPISQTLCCMVLLVGVALLTAKAEPFRLKSLNYAEQIASNVNVVVLIFGYFFQLGIWTPSASRTVAGVCNAIMVITILVLLFFVAMHTFPWIRHFVQAILNKAQDSEAADKLEYINPSVSGPQGNSMFVVPPSNKVRRQCWLIIRSSLFDRYIMAVVLMTSILSIVDFIPLEEGPHARLNVLNDIFTLLFCIECAMKILALGFVLGEHAYLRDTFNCVDFLVVLLSLLLWIAAGGGGLGGIRSARFFKYLKFFRIKYIRFLRIGLRMRQMSGGHVAAMYRKAIEPDTAKVKRVMIKAKMVFEANVCETIYRNLRNLPRDAADSAVDLIEEFYREGFDPEAIVRVSQQLHAVRRSVNKENLEFVYTWLAFHAKHSEKTAFLDTLVQSRDVMAAIGGKRVELEMSKSGMARKEAYEMSADEATLSVDMASELRRRKNAGKGDWGTLPWGGQKLGSSKWIGYTSFQDEEVPEGEDNNGRVPTELSPGGIKLRHGRGTDSTYRTAEERLQDVETDGRGDAQIRAFSRGGSNAHKRR
jgi:hypothetical protein